MTLDELSICCDAEITIEFDDLNGEVDKFCNECKEPCADGNTYIKN